MDRLVYKIPFDMGVDRIFGQQNETMYDDWGSIPVVQWNSFIHAKLIELHGGRQD